MSEPLEFLELLLADDEEDEDGDDLETVCKVAAPSGYHALKCASLARRFNLTENLRRDDLPLWINAE